MTVSLGEQSVITANTNVGACMKLRATLSNQDIASDDLFATKELDAQAFTFRIATVLTAAACFFMCHFYVPA